MVPWVNFGDWPSWLKVREVERLYAERSGGAVRFVGQLTLAGKHGWIEEPACVFWQEKPARPEYSNYFGLLRRDGNVMITNGQSVADGTWYGRLNRYNGEVVFSRFRHDYRMDSLNQVMVDGGRDYHKHNGIGAQVLIRFVDGRARVLDIETMTRYKIDLAISGK